MQMRRAIAVTMERVVAVEVLVCRGGLIVALATQEPGWGLVRRLVLPTRALASWQTKRAQSWLRATTTPLLQTLLTATQVVVPCPAQRAPMQVQVRCRAHLGMRAS